MRGFWRRPAPQGPRRAAADMDDSESPARVRAGLRCSLIDTFEVGPMRSFNMVPNAKAPPKMRPRGYSRLRSPAYAKSEPCECDAEEREDTWLGDSGRTAVVGNCEIIQEELPARALRNIAMHGNGDRCCRRIEGKRLTDPRSPAASIRIWVQGGKPIRRNAGPRQVHQHECARASIIAARLWRHGEGQRVRIANREPVDRLGQDVCATVVSPPPSKEHLFRWRQVLQSRTC